VYCIVALVAVLVVIADTLIVAVSFVSGVCDSRAGGIVVLLGFRFILFSLKNATALCCVFLLVKQEKVIHSLAYP
jgi:hypothetical protein